MCQCDEVLLNLIIVTSGVFLNVLYEEQMFGKTKMSSSNLQLKEVQLGLHVFGERWGKFKAC